MNLHADAVIVNIAQNAIQLRVPGFEERSAETGMLDVGANGRLLGLEVGETYIDVMESALGDDPYARTACIPISISGDEPPVVTIPRRGSSWEITYPSGNECWQTTLQDGKLIQVCAAIAD
ncbi:MAG TPA: hypothetical protein VNZ58_04425 [Thermomicrobiales bacterium]|nr:hypothetical protein [Thermomicrobiales bacterium]